MPRRIGDAELYRTPLEMFMTLNQLSDHELAKRTGLNAGNIYSARTGKRYLPSVLRGVEKAYNLKPGTLGSYSRIFRVTPFLWYRIERMHPNSKCRYCKQKIQGDIGIVVTLPYAVANYPVRYHAKCFMKLHQEWYNQLLKDLEDFANLNVEDVEYEVHEKGARPSRRYWNRKGSQGNQPDDE